MCCSIAMRNMCTPVLPDIARLTELPTELMDWKSASVNVASLHTSRAGPCGPQETLTTQQFHIAHVAHLHVKLERPIKAPSHGLQSRRAWHLQRREATVGKPVDAMLLLVQTEADGACACVVCILHVFPGKPRLPPSTPFVAAIVMDQDVAMHLCRYGMVCMVGTTNGTWMSSLNIDVPSG